MEGANVIEKLRTVAADALTAYRALARDTNLGLIVGHGADNEPTTKIDRELETAVIASMERLNIGGEVLSEEIGRYVLPGPAAPLLFVIDPLDGTTNAVAGIHYFALSIAVLFEGELYAALVMHYSSGDIFYAVRGGGAFLNGKRLQILKPQSLSKATLATSRPMTAAEMPIYSALFLAAKRIRIISCPALETAMVASGAFSAFVDFHRPRGLIGTHDVLAGRLVLEEAGGLFLDEHGETAPIVLDLLTKSNVFAVSDRSIFDEILKIIRDIELNRPAPQH